MPIRWKIILILTSYFKNLMKMKVIVYQKMKLN